MTLIKTPIVIFGFNRSSNIIKIRAAMSELKFRKVYFIVDGPRVGKSNEDIEVEKTLKEMKDFKNIEEKIFIESHSNMGCKRRIMSGIDLVFNRESEAIILEDDCIPVPEFFKYCESALQLYKNDPSVALISGSNLLGNKFKDKNSIGRSIFINCWGWAGWSEKTLGLIKRDIYLADLHSDLKESKTFSLLSYFEKIYWKDIIKNAINSNTVWDFYMQLGMFRENKYSIYPEHNLINNVGFDASATHTNHGVPRYVSDNPAVNKKANINIENENAMQDSIDLARDKLVTSTLYNYSFIKLIRLKIGNIKRFISY